jgi:type II secretory pathway pseudopilin PulG
VILVLVAALAAGVVGLVLLQRNSAKNAREQMVRNAIKTFNTAVQAGDLATLRSITCGQNRESYVSYDDDVWADTYPRVMAAKQYPVVQSVDEVVVNGDRAEANVTSYMAFDPATTSSRSFDLQFLDEQWKICQSS